jgi:cytochrome c biogenesis protein CcmG, thiol:disulfide interchange protein DsbE
VKVTTDRILIAAILLLTAGLVWTVAGTLEVRVINADDTAPSFSVVTEHGKTITRSDFGGKLLVLNFWASWCPPCISELPSLNQFAKEYAGQGVVVLGISNDKNEHLYKNFVTQRQVGFETARDPEANISTSYGTFQIPETYIIDRNGKVLEKVISDQNWMDPEFLARVKVMLGSPSGG